MTERTDNVCYRPSKTMLVTLFCVLVGVLFLVAIPTVWATPSENGACPPGTIPVAQVTIHGPTQGAPNVTHAFTAVVSPTGASPTVDYFWQPAPASGQSTASASYIWTTLGHKVIMVTAFNPDPYACGRASDWHEVFIAARIHLPVISKQ
jgi:hypothetical protein